MQIEHLREFLVLVENKNFWNASSRLFISQSALTKHIHHLEDEFGVPLFTRNSRNVELTPYGQAIIPYARKIVDAEFACKELIGTLHDELAGKLFLGVIPSMVPYKLTKLITGFNAQYPNDQLKVLEEDSLILKEALEQKKCSLAFLRESDNHPIDENEFHKIPYTTDHLVVLLSHEHPLANRSVLHLNDLKTESFILLNQGTLLNQIFMECFQWAGFVPNILVECQRMNSIFDFISLNMGISLTMNRHLHHLSDLNSRCAVIPVEPPVKSRTYLCYPKGAVLNEASRHFISYTKKMIPVLFSEKQE